MTTKKRTFILKNGIVLGVLSIFILFYVGQFQLPSLFSSIDQYQSLVKISSSDNQHKKDHQKGEIPKNENKQEEDNDEELKENSKEKNNLTAYHKNKIPQIDTKDFTDTSKLYILFVNNKKAFIPLFILFHSWKTFIL